MFIMGDDWSMQVAISKDLPVEQNSGGRMENNNNISHLDLVQA